MANDKLVEDLLKDIRDRQTNISDTLGKHTVVLEVMQGDVKRNTQGLQEHMEQTKAVKDLVVSHKSEAEARLASLESPYAAIKYIKRTILALGAGSGSVYGIMKLLDFLHK